ncbi:hypothetical protein Q8A73_022022 [Channa argus]|nr:hypothetical protein Q8A73_022022 [Channa argus]
MCLSLLCSAPIRHIHHRKINDRPKPSGSPSHSTASIGAVTGPPSLRFSLKSMCETPASHAGACLGESLGVDLVGEAQPFTQGSGQVEQRGETSCLPTDYSSQHRELENSSTGEQAKYYFTEFSYVTANISLAPELRREVDFINFMDLEMSRGDKAITLLSGDGGGVIKPIASDDEEVV